MGTHVPQVNAIQDFLRTKVSIKDRLCEERERLGMNQTDFGAIGGVSRRTQSNYESGERSPDADYLAAIAAIGADVTYILTGVLVQPLLQSPEPPTPPVTPEAEPATEAELSQWEKVIVQKLRKLDRKGKDEIQEAVEKVEWVKGLEQRVAELERRTG